MHKLKILNNNKELILSSLKPFLLGYIDNINNNNSNVYSSIGTNQDGINIDAITLKEKLLPIEGCIFAESKEDLERKRAYLSSFFNPYNSFTLIYSNNINTRKIKGRLQSLTFSKPIGVTNKFLIQILCPFPYWESLEERKTNIALWEGDFHFPLDISTNGIKMGHRVSNLICHIVNMGDVKCGIRICFKALGTVVNPSLFNINTREFIKINKTLNSGDILEVNTSFNNKRIELLKSNNTRENVFNWLELDSDFLQLDIGDNIFRYDAEKGLNNLELSVYHTPLFVGV